MKLLHRLLDACAICYACVFVLWRVLVTSPLFGPWWPLQVSEIFAVWSIVPALLLVLAGIVRRSRWLWVAIAIPVLWFCRDYGTLFVPAIAPRVRAKSESTELRVMTFNTWRQYDQDGEFAAKIAQWQPDLIAVQEVGPVFSRDLRELKAEWPYLVQASVRVTGRISVLSKWPILSSVADNRWAGCHCLQVVVDWNGMPVRVIAVHIRAPGLGPRTPRDQPMKVTTLDTSQQEAAYLRLLPLITQSPEPVLVLGDFNTTERQAGYQWLNEAGLTDAHEQAGWGLGMTYPAPFSRVPWFPISVIRIDHVFFSKAWRATRTWTTSLMGSDHQALVADLEWIGPK